MFKKVKPDRDVYSFSLGGMKTIASFVIAPAVAGDRINRAWDERLSQATATEQISDKHLEQLRRNGEDEFRTGSDGDLQAA